jgi:dimethylargininase
VPVTRVAIVRAPSSRLNECELTYIDRDPINIVAASAQHAAYCKILEACGAQVECLPASDDSPDSVFVEDTALVLDEIAVLCMPGAKSRRGEIDLIREVLSKHRPIFEIALPATIDGGDVLRVGRQLYVGRSTRTNLAAVQALREAVEPYGYKVMPVDISGSLHLKTACTALDDDTMLANPPWVNSGQFHAKRVLFVADDESWAANTLRVGETVLMNSQCPHTMALVSAAGYRVRAVDISEFLKAEAGLTCMSLVFSLAVGARSA